MVAEHKRAVGCAVQRLCIPSALVGVVLLAGCAMFKNAAPLPPPYDFAGDVRLHRGAGMNRMTTLMALPASDTDPANAHRLYVRVDQLEHMPEAGLSPLVMRAELVVTEDTTEPIRHALYLIQGARVGLADAARVLQAATQDGRAGRWSTLVERDVALPTVMSAEISLSARAEPPRNQDYPRTPEIEHPLRNRVVVNVGRRVDGSYSVAVALVDERTQPLDLLSDELDEFTSSENEAFPEMEVVLSDLVPEVGGGPFVLSLRSPFAGAAEVIVVYIDARPAPGGGADDAARRLHAEAVEAALAEGAESELEAMARAEPLTEADTVELARTRAFSELRENPDRVSLVYITGTSHARTALDMALVASEEEIVEFTRAVLPPDLELAESPLPLEVLAWHLDRGALLFMAAKYGEAKLSPELRGVLFRHVGEAGRYPGMLADAVEVCSNAEQFGQRMVAENRLSLEDSDPSARVRAFDWLRSHGGVPQGYDPLATRDERRSALERERDRARELAREQADAERELLEADEGQPRSETEDRASEEDGR